MRLKLYLLSIFATVGLLAASCGGSAQKTAVMSSEDREIEQESKLDEHDMESRAILKKAELTTEADDKRMRVLGEVQDEFKPSEKTIYLVATLKRVPTQAQIQVRWYKDNLKDPLLVAEISGSDTFSFVSSFSPTDKKFISGTYSVRIFVNDQETGGTSFTITGKDPFANGPKISRLKISPKVSSKMKPRKAAKKFKSGTRKLFATFNVSNALPQAHLLINWYREGSLFNEHTMTVEGSGRFGSDVNSPSGLPDGKYKVEIELDGNIAAKTSFVIGKASGEPAVDKVILGLSTGRDNMPKKEKTIFKAGVSVIFCGLRFLDTHPGSVITVQWNLVEEDGESLYHTTRTSVATGGSGTMGAKWAPDSSIEPGNYRVVVLINDEEHASVDFEVK